MNTSPDSKNSPATRMIHHIDKAIELVRELKALVREMNLEKEVKKQEFAPPHQQVSI